MKITHRFRLTATFLIAALCSCASPSSAGPTNTVALDNYILTGTYKDGEVTFTLHARATAPAKNGGDLALLDGPISPTAVPESLVALLDIRDGAIVLKSKDWSTLLIDLPFRTSVVEAGGWKTVDFTPAAANIRQIVLEGWPADAKVELPDASQSVRKDGRITANLPGSGHVALRWKEAPPETASKLFFSAEGAVIDTVAPGILRQTDQISLRVLQGKLEHIDLDLTGDGEVTHVDGPGILNWAVTPGSAGVRRLSVQLNAPQTGEYALTVQMESPLPALPATAKPPRLAPVGASSYGGRLRVQNEGTVRLEVTNTSGLSQIGPEQFPITIPPNTAAPTQAFAYRFADTGFSYSISADNVLPEFTTDNIIAYHLGETDTYLEAEIDLDIREAPLRELNLLGPADWAVAGLQAPYLADHFVTPADNGRAQLRLVFAQPLMGRQVVRLRLERNASQAATAATPADWVLPPLTVKDAKSSRGFVGVTSDASLRLTPTTMDGLTDATAAFPLKLDNLQAAWRYREDPWSATLHVERLAASIQADALHIFSIGDQLALGSTVLNLNIAGAPVNVLRLQNTAGYRNVEFTGRYKRDVTQTGNVFEIHLDRPVSGAYTLLATYELPFKASGDTLSFTGMRPLDVQSEQGHVLIASSHPFSITETNITKSMSQLEGAEIPAEYRLLCDAPILACYQYAAQPFDASLHLQPLTASRTVDQVVDIADLDTRVTSSGEVSTTARYLLKSKGHDFLSLSLPAGAKLWNVKVANEAVVPIADKSTGGQALLVPLPRKGDPNVPVLIEMTYTAAATDAATVTVNSPSLEAPVLATDWKLSADHDRRLRALEGAPVMETPRLTGLDWLAQTLFGNGPKPRSPVVPLFLRWHASETSQFSQSQTLYMGLALGLAGLVILRSALKRRTLRKCFCTGLGLVLTLAGIVLLAQLGHHAADVTQVSDSLASVQLSIPVVEAGHALSFTFVNETAPKAGVTHQVDPVAWLLLPGLALAALAWFSAHGILWQAVAWVLTLAGLLGLPQGPELFCGALALAFACALGRAFLALRNQRPPTSPSPGPAPATAVALLALFCWLGSGFVSHARAADAAAKDTAPKPGLVLSLVQTGTVKDDYLSIHAELTWRAEQGSLLPLLRAPAVLSAFSGDSARLTLTQDAGVNSGYVVTAREAGTYKISFAYEIRANAGNAGAMSIALPTSGGLVNQVTLELARADLDAASDNAVSLHTTPAGDHPRVAASFAPNATPSLRWSPRARDLSVEKPVYYADWRQLYTPAAGIVDGRHEVHLRLAQGEIKELIFAVPASLTISQVEAAGLSSWRFDPDLHKLHAYFDPARKSAFDLVIHSQGAATPLPYTATLRPIRLEGAAADAGLMAAATTTEVELGSVTSENLTTVNLDDFPAAIARAAAPRGEAYTVRRAYSYGVAAPTLKTEALAVLPDVRVDSLERFSLGEDRMLLATHLNVVVNRAGIFKLSFVLPEGFEIDTISGDQLSHQTESKVGNARVITLNLKGKTIGNLSFDITLSSPGLATRQNWSLPRVAIIEASKQTGQLVLLPELGLRPQIHTRENLTQIDPREAGIDTAGALVFRVLQGDWTLALDIDKVDPHIQVDVLQDVLAREGSTEVRANLNYQIDNAGVRELRLQVPADANGVHITGALVSDSLPVDGQPGQWLVRLQRRSIGALSLTVVYQLPTAGADNRLAISGVQTLGTDLQRGFIDLRARGRLETRVTSTPPELLPTDWETVPVALRHDFDGDAPSQTFRAVSALFTLPVELVHHDAAKVLPARIEAVRLRSLVSSDGQLLTEASVDIFPGDLRNLNITLPAGSKFWFAFVNDKGVTPSLHSQNPNDVLLPLEANPDPSRPATVEFLYQQKAPTGGETNLAGPRFVDLPLQNISWQLYLPSDWAVTQWDEPWQKTSAVIPVTSSGWQTLEGYLAGENSRLSEQNAKAENFLLQGNQLLQKGQQMQARQLFSNAYQISQKDSAFNEDARVQWQNLRENQAMVSLANGSNSFNGNLQQNSAQTYGGSGGAQNGPPQSANLVLTQSELLNFTDQQARKILGSNPAEENAVLAELAHALVKQQADTLPHPVAIHATLPERGQVIEFTQSLLVTPNADLSLKLTAGPAARPAMWNALGALAVLGLLLSAGLKFSRPV